MYHTTLKATLMQLVFGRHKTHPIFHHKNWNYVRVKEYELMSINNKEENTNSIHHTYQDVDNVILVRFIRTKVREREYDDSYIGMEIDNNKWVKVQKLDYSDVVYIRQLTLYH